MFGRHHSIIYNKWKIVEHSTVVLVITDMIKKLIAYVKQWSSTLLLVQYSYVKFLSNWTIQLVLLIETLLNFSCIIIIIIPWRHLFNERLHMYTLDTYKTKDGSNSDWRRVVRMLFYNIINGTW